MPLLTALGLALLLSAQRPANEGPPGGDEAHGSLSAGAILSAADEDGFGVVGEWWHEGRTAPIPIPLVTRAPEVQRAVPSSRGIRLRLSSSRAAATSIDRVSVHAVRHADDSQLLVVGDAVLLVGPPTLPYEVELARGAARAPGDGLPLLARQDGLATERPIGGVQPPRSLPDGHRLVAIGRDPVHQAHLRGGSAGGSRTACLIDSPAELVGGRLTYVDQLFYAAVQPLAPGDGEQLSPRSARLGRGPNAGGELAPNASEVLASLLEADRDTVLLDGSGVLELALPAPPADEVGTTWTLLVELELRRAALPGEAPVAVSASATRAAAEPDADAGLWSVAESPGRIGALDFVHLEGPDLQLDIRPTMGPGLACGDVDDDGDPDLYLVQGGGREGSRVPANRLLENRSSPGSLEFLDVTEDSGAGHRGAGMGALFFDAEGDGDLDLYLANYGADVLYLGDGRGRFTDHSREAGIGGARWSAGVAAADTDLDGDLDLYVTSYLDYDESKMPTDEGFDRYRREDPIAMLPFAFPGDRNLFLRNDSWLRVDGELRAGPVRFTDRTDELGLADEQGRGMQPVFWDFDRDGDQDLYVANDVSMNSFFRNEGDGSFENVSFTTGMDDPRGGMGVSVGDVDGDGDEDLFLTNWQLEANALYLNNLIAHRSRKSYIASFRDTIVRSGLGRFGVGATSWGAELFDADLDGDLDLFVANGYTSPDYESTGICVGQPNHFFLGDGEGRFEAALGSAALDQRAPSRAAVACDLDRDGDPDLVLTNNNGPAVLLENHAERGRNSGWLGLRLRGRAPNTHAIGAEVDLRAGELRLRRSLRAGTSYLAGNAPELLFGLGSHAGAVDLSVRWPSGRQSEHRVEQHDRWIVVEEPE